MVGIGSHKMQINTPSNDLAWHALTAISSSILLPLAGWLLKSYTELRERTLRLEVLTEKQEKAGDDNKQDIAAILQKLDVLPRVEEALRNLAQVCQQIVPRGEMQAKLDAKVDKA
jgi:hypothetical protein